MKAADSRGDHSNSYHIITMSLHPKAWLLDSYRLLLGYLCKYNQLCFSQPTAIFRSEAF